MAEVSCLKDLAAVRTCTGVIRSACEGLCCSGRLVCFKALWTQVGVIPPICAHFMTCHQVEVRECTHRDSRRGLLHSRLHPPRVLCKYPAGKVRRDINAQTPTLLTYGFACDQTVKAHLMSQVLPSIHGGSLLCHCLQRGCFSGTLW